MQRPVDETILKARLGERIRTLREARGLSQQEAAARIGVARSFLARLEGGGHNPSIVTLLRIAHAFDIALPTVVEGLEDR